MDLFEVYVSMVHPYFISRSLKSWDQVPSDSDSDFLAKQYCSLSSIHEFSDTCLMRSHSVSTE